jgi:transposase
MAGRSKSVLDVREMLRRLRAGDTDRRIARELGVSRRTVRKYREQAEESGWLQEEQLVSATVLEEVLRQVQEERLPGPISRAERYRTFIESKRSEGVEIQALLGLLRERGYEGSYSSLRRFVSRAEKKAPEVFVRVETGPGEEGQVDFGYAGFFYDPRSGRMRKGWVFVMTLGFSRHQYAEIVFDQKIETWIELHVRAFEWFGGTVKRIVLDNLRAGIVKAVIHDQEAQRSYRELAEHYGFLISPCRPGTPRHKGKVESGVRYVKRNALAGREFRDVEEANRHLLRWVEQTAGTRIHGTTQEQPLVRFEREREKLRPLPTSRYEVVVWKQAKLHPDCHMVFDYSYYSGPHWLVGKKLWLKATPRRVEVYRGYERIATHERASQRGSRKTIPDHLPPEKLAGLLPEPLRLRTAAKEVGPFTGEFIERLLGEKPLDRLRGAQGVLKLRHRYTSARLEAACRRALAFDELRYHTVKDILKRGLDLEPVEVMDSGPLPKTSLFARSVVELVPAGLRWGRG